MKNILVVQSNPAPGREPEYNEWYNGRHLSDVLSFPGFVAAQRFVQSPVKRFPDWPEYKYRYLALYEFEGSVRSAYDHLTQAISGPKPIYISPALDEDRTGYAFTAITDRIERRR